MLKLLLLVTLALPVSIASNAAVINPSGDINNKDFHWGKSESNYLQTYDESQNVSIEGGQIRVDYLFGNNLFVGDTVTGKHHSKKLTLSEGRYNSHLLHFDPIGTSKGKLVDINITFEEDIVAIILDKKLLNKSNQIFGNINSDYEKNRSHGLEGHDILSFVSLRNLSIDRLWVGKYWTDDARIITRSVPEPGSYVLFGLGIICLIGARSLPSQPKRSSRK